mmetsp:Transcript_1774/g.5433  ORF Transcript_1774/g.5433 Transcript_1774/m.5433 type:complete len:245 (+) Transcript_1774:666-1400(+)
MDTKSVTPTSTMSRSWLSKMRPSTMLLGRFFEWVATAKAPQSFLLHKNSMRASLSKGRMSSFFRENRIESSGPLMRRRSVRSSRPKGPTLRPRMRSVRLERSMSCGSRLRSRRSTCPRLRLPVNGLPILLLLGRAQTGVVLLLFLRPDQAPVIAERNARTCVRFGRAHPASRECSRLWCRSCVAGEAVAVGELRLRQRLDGHRCRGLRLARKYSARVPRLAVNLRVAEPWPTIAATPSLPTSSL